MEQKSAEITGYAKTKVLGKPFVSTHITSDYKASVQTVLDNALQGKETANYEVPIFTKENKRRIICSMQLQSVIRMVTL